ncbi:hypothetical protein BDN72DRAFT_801194 [Pluteus cervinus]|uniref:Uncharacterized protein n=1 Tax=Pluteus cervinus TaxID=181527 RepID=A0ACD3AIA0_9AGAR|nr:hypothetical protein BDN72DRAFT_801194 [Pluteus cervinus]
MHMLPPLDLPEGVLLLITDELASPSDFLLHKCLLMNSKEARDSKIIVLSVSEGLTKWKTVASRSNLNLTRSLESGGLQFVDVLTHVDPPSPSSDTTGPSLKPIFDLVLSSIKGSKSPPLIILDDISSLEWIGFPSLDIIRFVRALNALCAQNNATFVIRYHIVTPDGPDDTLTSLQQLCSYHIDVRPLSSGRSGAVSGEISVYPGPATIVSPNVRTIPRSAALQYRLTDTGAVFFERGTGGGVL